MPTSFKRVLRNLDADLLGSRLRLLYSRFFVAGQHWARFWLEAEKDNRVGAWVLDAGAGQAQFKGKFTRARYVAVDTTVGDEAWDYSRLDVVGDLIRLPFGPNRFDQILCTEVLEHVTRPHCVVAEFARVLKPGGRVLLSTPQSWPQHQKPHDFFRYTSFGLRMLFEQAGLDVLWMKPAGGAFTHLLFSLTVLGNDDLWAERPWLSAATRAPRRLLEFVLSLLKPVVALLDILDTQADNTVGWFVCAGKAR